MGGLYRLGMVNSVLSDCVGAMSAPLVLILYGVSEGGIVHVEA